MKKHTWKILGILCFALGIGVDSWLWIVDKTQDQVGTVYAVGKHDSPPRTSTPVGGEPESTPPIASPPITGPSSWWNHSSANFRLEMASSPYTGRSPSRPLLHVQPHQTVYLLASYRHSLPSVHWQTENGGTISSDNSGYVWRMNQKIVQIGAFHANQPGVYMVRATYGKKSSVPIPILVGASHLFAGAPKPHLQKENGVLAFRSFSNTPINTGQEGIVRFREYSVENGDWIPIAGQVPDGLHRISVQLDSAEGIWTYRLPVSADGDFSAKIRSPFSGQVSVALIPHLIKQLNQKNQYSFQNAFTVYVPKMLSKRKTALLDSVFMDGNLWLRGQSIAKGIYQAAGGGLNGAAALSTYVSERLTYNLPMGEGKIPYSFEDVSEAAKSDLGVCMQYAEMLAVLLHDVDVPAQTVIGQVGSDDSEHEWVQADINGTWVSFDPTWDEPTGGDPPVVTNDYLANRNLFSHSRTVQVLGSWQ